MAFDMLGVLYRVPHDLPLTSML
jgi:hypothetical protein